MATGHDACFSVIQTLQTEEHQQEQRLSVERVHLQQELDGFRLGRLTTSSEHVLEVQHQSAGKLW